MANTRLISQSFPDAIDFGFCTVGQNNTQTFTLINHTKQSASFNFDSSKFHFEPSSGSIAAKSSQEIKISFQPTEAIVIVANAILYVNEEDARIIKLSAIGKYPHLELSASKMDFEYLLLGKRATKDLIIKNISQVPAKFEIRKLEEDSFKDNSFSFDIKTGEIPPQASFLVKVRYQPSIVYLDSIVHFEVVCQGGNTIPLDCRGCAMGFDVQLDTSSINFGDILLNEKKVQELTIQNNSDLPTTFQVFNDRKNVFSFSASSGSINKASAFRLRITFNPKASMNYYERVFILVANHQVVYVDLLGTCHDLLVKPKPVLQNHVDIFRRRVIEGKYRKEDLVQIRQRDTIGSRDRSSAFSMNHRVTFNNSEQSVADDSIMELPIENPSQVVIHKELFQELSSPNRLVSINTEALDFGYCSPLTLSAQQEIQVTNNLHYKVTIYWILQQDKSELGASLTVFNIFPQTTTIKPKSTQTFNVTFRPTKGASYFFQKLQFFAVRNDPSKTDNIYLNHKARNNVTVMDHYNTMNVSGSQDLVLEDEVQPPVSGSIACVGHSFSLSSQTFIPILDISPGNKVYFRPCGVGENMYTTVQLVNKTDTPVYYKFGYDTNRIFRVFPICGLIEGNSFNVVCFEFTPKEPKTYVHTISCSLNHNFSDQMTFKLYGYCFEPKLEIQNNGDVYFPSSYIGVVSKQKVKIHNVSRVALEYKIDIPKKYDNELYLEPPGSILKPNEIKYLLSSFVPYRKKDYKISVPIKVMNVIDPHQSMIGFHIPGSGSHTPLPEKYETTYKMHVFGVGGDGPLDISPGQLDFGIVKVNFSRRLSFVIENRSPTTFYIVINLTPKNEKMSEAMKQTVVNSFKLEFTEGKIPGNSRLEIGINFTPLDIFKANVELECIATEKNPKAVGKPSKIYSEKCSLNINAEGSYPKLKLVDVRNDSISVSTLWENFSVNHINGQLLENLTEDERKYNTVEHLTFEEAQRLQKKLTCFAWNFGYLSNKQPIKPRKVVITIQNIGGTDLKWKFQFPSDDYVSTEPWADPGEPTPEEAFEKAMIEKKIFEIKPREGELKAGELCDIELFYSPSFDDRPSRQNGNRSSNEEHYLNIVFQIINGKPLSLRLNGTTLAPLKGLLAVRKANYTLPPVPIGSLLPAYYPIEIQNVGTGKITYKVDTESLNAYADEKIKATSKLLDVKEAKRTLNANEKSYLYCLFKPLEAKKYEFHLPIEVSDFISVIQTLNVTLTGQGYNARPPRDEIGIKEEIPRQRSFVSTLGSSVFFSIEELDFGEVESQKPQYRLIILYNASKTRRLRYDVFTYGLECEDTLIIDPPKQEVEPETFVQLKVTLIPNIVPSFYEGEIEFSITWLNQDSPQGLVPHGLQSQEDKELLFLRIKKKSKFLDEKKKFIPLEHITNTEHREDKHIFEIIISKAINDVLNDPATDEMLTKIQKLPVQLYDQFDGEEPADIHKISEGLDDKIVKAGPDHNDFRNTILMEEFTDLVDTIMENTFFNIIQHATLKEIDLLKPSKIYLTPI